MTTQAVLVPADAPNHGTYEDVVSWLNSYVTWRRDTFGQEMIAGLVADADARLPEPKRLRGKELKEVTARSRGGDADARARLVEHAMALWLIHLRARADLKDNHARALTPVLRKAVGEARIELEPRARIRAEAADLIARIERFKSLTPIRTWAMTEEGRQLALEARALGRRHRLNADETEKLTRLGALGARYTEAWDAHVAALSAWIDECEKARVATPLDHRTVSLGLNVGRWYGRTRRSYLRREPLVAQPRVKKPKGELPPARAAREAREHEAWQAANDARRTTFKDLMKRLDGRDMELPLPRARAVMVTSETSSMPVPGLFDIVAVAATPEPATTPATPMPVLGPTPAPPMPALPVPTPPVPARVEDWSAKMLRTLEAKAAAAEADLQRAKEATAPITPAGVGELSDETRDLLRQREASRPEVDAITRSIREAFPGR